MIVSRVTKKCVDAIHDFEYEVYFEGHNINLSQNIVLHYLT